MSARALLLPPHTRRPLLQRFFSTTSSCSADNATPKRPSRTKSSRSAFELEPIATSTSTHPPSTPPSLLEDNTTKPKLKVTKPKNLPLPKHFSLRQPRRSALKSVEEIDAFLKQLEGISPTTPTADEATGEEEEDWSWADEEEGVAGDSQGEGIACRIGRSKGKGPLVSPLANPNIKKTYAQRYPKTSEQQPFLPWQVALRNNPFARMLIAPVRQSSPSLSRLPTSHLLHLTLHLHPTTHVPYLLPWNPHDGSPRRLGASNIASYLPLSSSIIHKISSQPFKRTLMQFIPPTRREDLNKMDLKWRHDCVELVGGRMREVVEKKLVTTAWKWGWDLAVFNEGGEEATLTVGRGGEEARVPVGVMDWRSKEKLESEALREAGEGEWQEEWGVTVDCVKGRVVPRWEMRRLVGEKVCEKVEEDWKGKGWGWENRVVVWGTERSRGLATELQSLRIWEDVLQRPVESEEEEE